MTGDALPIRENRESAARRGSWRPVTVELRPGVARRPLEEVACRERELERLIIKAICSRAAWIFGTSQGRTEDLRSPLGRLGPIWWDVQDPVDHRGPCLPSLTALSLSHRRA